MTTFICLFVDLITTNCLRPINLFYFFVSSPCVQNMLTQGQEELTVPYSVSGCGGTMSTDESLLGRLEVTRTLVQQQWEALTHLNQHKCLGAKKRNHGRRTSRGTPSNALTGLERCRKGKESETDLCRRLNVVRAKRTGRRKDWASGNSRGQARKPEQPEFGSIRKDK